MWVPAVFPWLSEPKEQRLVPTQHVQVFLTEPECEKPEKEPSDAVVHDFDRVATGGGDQVHHGEQSHEGRQHEVEPCAHLNLPEQN